MDSNSKVENLKSLEMRDIPNSCRSLTNEREQELSLPKIEAKFIKKQPARIPTPVS